MKEKIYTIPVNEAFSQDCECALCVLEKKLEEEAVEYFLGPSLMEPDHRMETNKNGFCRRHFELLYNRQENRLGLGLILDTHLREQSSLLKKTFQDGKAGLERDVKTSALSHMTGKLTGKLSGKQSETEKLIDRLTMFLSDLEDRCEICNKLSHTIDRYIDVILYLYFEETEFRRKLSMSKGFCLIHLRQLLEGAKKYLSPRESAAFISVVMENQLKNMERIEKEVDWFTKKFDYRYTDAPWENSKDALPRGIQKLVGPCRLK